MTSATVSPMPKPPATPNAAIKIGESPGATPMAANTTANPAIQASAFATIQIPDPSRCRRRTSHWANPMLASSSTPAKAPNAISIGGHSSTRCACKVLGSIPMVHAAAAPAAVAPTQSPVPSRGSSRRSIRDCAQPRTAPSPTPASTSNTIEVLWATPTLVAVAPTIAGMAKPASSPQVVATTHRRYLGSSLAETLVTIRPASFDLIARLADS